MPVTTLAGHPLHPQLVGFPIGLLPFSFAMDVMHYVTGRYSYAQAAYYSLVGGCAGAVAAGASGAVDYLTIPSGTQTKKDANLHAILNLSVLGLFAVSLWLRHRRSTARSSLPMILSGIGTAGLIVSQWYGGHMVYEHGMRVKGISPEPGPSELKLPGDERIASAFERLEEAVAPAGGPQF